MQTTLFICLSLLASSPCDALKDMTPTYRGTVPENYALTMTAPGVDYRYYDHADDQGPPWDVKRCMLGATGVNMSHIHVGWEELEPYPPGKDGTRRFYTGNLRQRVQEVPEGHYIMVHVGFAGGKSWQGFIEREDEDHWWELAEEYMTQALIAIREEHPEPEEIIVKAPGNEPSLTGRPDWARTHMKPVPHFYRAIKKAHPRNLLMVGALVVGRRGHIESLYREGLKDNFDILDVHSYDDTGGKAFLSLDQLIETRQVLVDHGDVDKRIWLGEGYAPFPLPGRIDDIEHERYRAGEGMSLEPYDYSDEDIEHYRKSIIRGWYNLMTPRATWDPMWVFGVSYFCLNDMWGSVGWKERAIPHYDDQGNIEWWDLDGYHIPYRPYALEPLYRPWGVIDAHGNPKGDIIVNIPPYLPKHTFAARADVPYEGHVAQVIAGVPVTVTLTFTSEEDAPYKNANFTMDTRENNERFGVSFHPLEDMNLGDLAHGETVTRTFEMTFPPELAGRELCVIGELHYTWAERIPYYASAWIDCKVLPAARQEFRHDATIASGPDASVEVGVTVVNETVSIFNTTVRAVAGPELIIEPRQHSVNLHRDESTEVTFQIRRSPDAALGTYPFRLDTGSALTSIESEVTFPLPAPDVTANPWGLVRNGDFEEAVGERGHAYWSGDMSDWDTGDAMEGLEGAGERCLTYAANGVDPTKNIWQTMAWEKPAQGFEHLSATLWAKGEGYELDATPAESTFQLFLVAMDESGGQLARHESPVFRGTGEWVQLEHDFPAPPEATRYIRFEIECAISRGNGWHLHHVDQVALQPK